ncbi:MAG: Helicase associated domain protein [Hyphomicrobiaceae bacterium]
MVINDADLHWTWSRWADVESALSKLGPDGKTEKGRVFEELTRLYLLTNPIFATRLVEVWHHTDVPQKVADELGLQRPEIGVDLVALTRDGDYWAIQCKFHQDRSQNVTYDELKTFLSITERKQTYEKLSHRIVATSANGISDRVHKAHPHKLAFLTAADFTSLGPDDFRCFRELLQGEKPTFQPWSPRPHQRSAVAAAIKHFKDAGNTRGKLIHPCGSGKSLTAYWISEALSSKTVLIAVPSLSLVRQTLGSWTRESVANSRDMKWLAVCSDQDVSKSDDPAMRAVDLGIDVTADREIVASFLSSSTDSTKVLMTTYQSGRVVSEGVGKAKASFDLGVFDEAHKTVGAEGGLFAHLLSDANVPISRRVFMTATERQYRGNSDDILSMDDASVYGGTFDQLSFKAALELDPPILSDYRIVSIIVTKSEIERLIAENAFVRSDGKEWSLEGDAPTFASLVALRKSIEKYGIRHTVSFHRSIKRAKEFTELNKEASKADTTLGSLQSFHVSGSDSTGTRAAVIDRFVDAVPSLITNARCLTEGVDVPAIDAVLFADPRQSKIDIVQAAGRAMRRFEGKRLGYIIVPVIIDEDSDEPSDDAFVQIIKVVSALAMEDERIIEEFKSIAPGKRSCGTNIVEIDVPEYVRIEFGDLLENIETRIWDRLGWGWEKGFERLKAYLAKNGQAQVAASYVDETGFRLGSWTNTRRVSYKNGNIAAEQVAALEALPGWTWDVRRAEFEEGLKKLKAYVVIDGRAKPPDGFKDRTGYPLGRWVNNRRQDYKSGRLSPDKMALLEAFPGWDWSPGTTHFEKGMARLEAFAADTQHAQVPATYVDETGFKLGLWVFNRRRDFRTGKLAPENIAALENIKGWTWNPFASKFEEGLERLKAFVAIEKHARVPASHVDDTGFKLGDWVVNQRQAYRRGKLPAEKVGVLESIDGWVWKVRGP